MKHSNFAVKKNLAGVFMLITFCFVAVGVGLGYRTLVQGAELQSKAENTRTRSVTVAQYMTVLVRCWRLVLALILWLLIQARLMIRISRVWLKSFPPFWSWNITVYINA